MPIVRSMAPEMGGRIDQPSAVEHVDIAETYTAHEGVEDAFVPEIVWHEGGNHAPD